MEQSQPVVSAMPVLTSPEAQALDFTKFNAEKQYSFVVLYNAKVSEMPGGRLMRLEPYCVGSQLVSGAVKVGTWLPQNKPAWIC